MAFESSAVKRLCRIASRGDYCYYTTTNAPQHISALSNFGEGISAAYSTAYFGPELGSVLLIYHDSTALFFMLRIRISGGGFGCLSTSHDIPPFVRIAITILLVNTIPLT
jgi:hypothetical protein